MSVVSLLGVKTLNNPASFLSPYQFEITFECLEQLQKGEYMTALAGIGPYLLTSILRSGMEIDLRRFCDFVSLVYNEQKKFPGLLLTLLGLNMTRNSTPCSWGPSPLV